MTIGDRIKIARKKIGMKQSELATLTKISKQSIYKYENNIITNIPSDKIEAIASTLQTTPAYLMGWIDSPNESVRGTFYAVDTKVTEDKLHNFVSEFVIPKLIAVGMLSDNETISDENALSLYKRLGFSVEKTSNNNSGEIIFTSNEHSLIKKYRDLDDHGKMMVDFALTEETARMKRENLTVVETEDLIHFLAPVSAGDGTLLDEADHKTVKVVSNTYTRRADFMVSVRGKSMEPRFFDGDLVLVQETDDIEIGEVGIWYLDGRSYIKQKGHGRLISLNEKYFDVFMEEFSTCRCQGRVIGTLDPDWIVG